MAPAHLKNVALLAATGNLGSKILGSLRGAGFNVTAIQRKGSDKKVPEGVPSIQADLTSKADLVSAFKGQDVVVSAVPNPEFDNEKTMIDAAIEAGIKRLVPSEYSSNLEAKAKDINLDNVKEKLRIRKYVEEVAAGGKIEWSSINNGPFLDMSIKYGFFGPNIRTKTTTYHNGGDKIVCTTSTSDIADAVALMLQHAEETKNKPIYVYSVAISEQKITEIVSKLTGIRFDVQNADIYKDADEYFDMLKRGEDVREKFFAPYMLMMYGEGFGGDYRDAAMNKALGLRVMDDQELETSIAQWLTEAGLLN